MAKEIRKSWIRFSLKALMVAFLIATVSIATYSARVSRQREAAAAVRDLGGTLTYNDHAPNFLQDKIANFLGADYVYDVVGVSLWEQDVTDAELRLLPNFVDLSHLELSGTQITNKTLKLIGKMRSLESVGLNNVTLVDDDGIIFLSNLKNLNHLALWNTGTGDRGIKSIAELPKLLVLIAGGTKVTDKGTECLVKSKSIVKLVFQRTSLSDESLSNLCQIEKLRSLSLSETEITDVGLEHLKNCRNLKDLAVFNTLVTDEARKALKLSLPGIRIR